jgi:hypothetical protein
VPVPRREAQSVGDGPVWLHHSDESVAASVAGMVSHALVGLTESCAGTGSMSIASPQLGPTPLTMDREAFVQAMETLSNLRATKGKGSGSVG